MTSINKNTFHGPSFSFRNRAGRLLWGIIWRFCGALAPRSAHAFRVAILRAFGAKIGGGVHVYSGARIWAPWNLVMKDGASIGDGAVIYSQAPIVIGCMAIVSQGAHLCGGTHDYETTGHPLVAKPISIGAYAWVAAEAFVHPGVTIGEGAIVGARSVVTRDVEPWAVYAGHPAKFLKKRNWRPTNIK